MKCFQCNSETKNTVETYHYKESGLDNVYLENIDVYRCTCGEYYVSIPAVTELNTLIAMNIINKKAFLTGSEIRYLRKNAGLSATDFAEFIGVNKSTLSRWENDKQTLDKSSDRMIRLFYLSFKGIPKEKMATFFNEVIKKISHNGRAININIPVDRLVPALQV